MYKYINNSISRIYHRNYPSVFRNGSSTEQSLRAISIQNETRFPTNTKEKVECSGTMETHVPTALIY